MAEMNIVRSQSRVAVAVAVAVGEKAGDGEMWERDRNRGEKCRRKGGDGRLNESTCEKERRRNAWVRLCVPHC